VRRLVVIALVAAAAAAVLLAGEVHQLDHTRVVGLTYVKGYEHARTGLDKALGIGDGQAYAQIARDPTLALPDRFRGGARSAAYRFGRPFLGEVVWVLSLGRSGAVPVTMAVVCVAALGAAAAALAALIARCGGNPWYAVGVAFLPGAWSATIGLTSETLALAFAAWGVVLWTRRRRPTPAVIALFCLAVLTRETMVLVPLALAIWSWRRAPHGVRRADVALVAIPAAVVAAWYVIVDLRVGAWPFAGGPTDTFGLPFAGMYHEASRWSGSAADLLALAAGIVLLVLAFRSDRDDPLRAILIAYLLFAPLMGPAVWRRWQDFGRPLLPLYAFALVLVAGYAAAHRTQEGPGSETVEPQVMSSMR